MWSQPLPSLRSCAMRFLPEHPTRGNRRPMNTTGNDDMDEGSDRYNVPALERGLRVLCEFSREHRSLSAPELARRFALPRSTVFRLLTTLENMGFLEKAEG